MGLRVLHLIDSGGLYGAEKMLLSLVQEQVKQGLQPMIFSAGEPGIDEKPIEAEARKKGLPVTPWRMKSGLNLKESWKILKWAQRSGYNLLHSHGFKFNVLLGMYPEKFRRIPMIATLHGYVHAPRFSKLWIYETLDRFSIYRMRGVVLVGEAMKKELTGKLSNTHAVVIRNGLNIWEIRESSQAPIHEPFKSFFDNHEVVILGVGRLSREKGFDRLISAFSELRKQFPSSGLIIVGEGGLRNELDSLIVKLGVKCDVLMPGYCSIVPALLSRSSLLVMPSLTEGLPITLLEAMSLKTPVVASAVGEIPIVLGDGQGGDLLSNVEPATISKAIEKSLTQKELSSRKVDYAHETSIKNYSSEAMARRYLEFYNRVLVTL
ncbi:glycosyltransferase [Marinobacter confluentis]|uniref:Glycosyltransferase n=1 Tax=Marinobacter confluentis TaxID=1697557 RepID=A0A4Z1BTR5_9GAMM|nr:glycosyltransferase [Marinobacter confluentis]TGN41515.1 glycosyltransferase [Marinobacter confluentis]